METNWASDHLQVIRTLMERSALYRRALAPIMIVSGLIGLLAAAVPCLVKIESNRQFGIFWMSVSLLAVAAAFLLARRQALKEAEPFWSPPTRRVAQALLPAFVAGLVAGGFHIGQDQSSTAWVLAPAWILIYGCALHAAGFFMPRGIRWFGWLFVLAGSGLFFAAQSWSVLRTVEAAHFEMGALFGGLQLVFGIYLLFSEKRRRTA